MAWKLWFSLNSEETKSKSLSSYFDCRKADLIFLVNKSTGNRRFGNSWDILKVNRNNVSRSILLIRLSEKQTKSFCWINNKPSNKILNSWDIWDCEFLVNDDLTSFILTLSNARSAQLHKWGPVEIDSLGQLFLKYSRNEIKKPIRPFLIAENHIRSVC